jgi:peptide/nickel transport system permease protein
MAIFLGIAISLGVFGFNLFGDSLRDALDPRLRTQ